MDFSLSSEDKMIRDAVRGWAAKECPRDLVRKWDDEKEIPSEVPAGLAELGFFGITIPEEYGGQGINHIGACLVLEELAKMSAPLASIYSEAAFFGGAMINATGSELQKEKLLSSCADGKMKIAPAIFERESAFFPIGMNTTAEKSGAGFILNGKKDGVPAAMQADMLLIAALYEDKAGDSGKPVFFLLDKSARGLEITAKEKMGFSGASFCDVVLRNVQASEDDVLGGAGGLEKGLALWPSVRGYMNLACSAQSVGLAQGAFDYALDYSKQRIQFDQPIGTFPAIRDKFSELATKIHAARLMTLRAAWLADRGGDFGVEALMAEKLAAETARQAGLDGLHVLGGYGYTMEYDIQRYLRDSLCLAATGGTLEALNAGIGESFGL